MKKTFTPTSLTGISTTGIPHLGNYVGAIRPAIAMSHYSDKRHFYFLADYHALIKCQEPERIQQSALAIGATWLAMGLNPDKALFYRQSDIAEIPQLMWLLNCVAAKGLMNRAHAYKDVVSTNLMQQQDADFAVTMGLFSYPVLMSADILMFNATHVPVGKDQIQHLEIARDIAQRFNYIYGEHFSVPEMVIDDSVGVLSGLDGKKMSKSYDNTIPLFLPSKQLKKHINRIVTNSLEPNVPKQIEGSTVFEIWQAFANPEQIDNMKQAYADGIAWGEAKRQLFDLLDGILEEPRERYQQLISEPKKIEKILLQGAEKASAICGPFMQELRHAVGLRALK